MFINDNKVVVRIFSLAHSHKHTHTHTQTQREREKGPGSTDKQCKYHTQHCATNFAV